MSRDQSTENCSPATISSVCDGSSQNAAFVNVIYDPVSEQHHSEGPAHRKTVLTDQDLKEVSNFANGESVKHTEMKNRKHNSNEENGVAKGVVLNAHTFVRSSLSKWPPESGINDKSRDHELVQQLKVSEAREVVDGVKRKGQMTLWRKMAFAFSFLPSILFILCFAVILPCEEPRAPERCMTEMWTRSLNTTEFVAGPGITKEMLLGLYSNKEGGLLSLNSDSGEQLWIRKLQSKPRFIYCEDYDVNRDGVSDCLVADRSGWLHAVNTSDGYTFWNYSTSVSTVLPVLLSDCDGDGVPEIAFSDDYGAIQILSGDQVLFQISACNITEKCSLTAWKHHNKTDIVFSCQNNDGIGKLKHIPQNKWCWNQKDVQNNENNSELLDSPNDQIKLNNALLVSTPESLVVWVEELVVSFGEDANEMWRIHVSNHTQKRFLMYGNFSVGEQVALISCDTRENVLITLLDTQNGNETLTWRSPKTQLKEVISTAGKGQHYLVMLFEELQNTKERADISQRESFRLDEASDRSNTTEHIEHSLIKVKTQKVMRKIVLFQFKKNSDIVLEKEMFTDTYDIIRETDKDETRIAATIEGDRLTLFLGKTVFNTLENIIGYNTYLKKLETENWDPPLPECATTN